jgi:putative transposase
MPWKQPKNHAPLAAFIDEVLSAKMPFGHACRKHGISRKTGYKWWNRFLKNGRAGLNRRSCRPRRLRRRWPQWVRTAVNQERRRHRHWGAKKLCWALRQRWPGRRLPHPRTLERWSPRPPRRHRARRGPQLPALKRRSVRRPNDVWTIDFKGWFRTADGARIDPLTVRDLHSRYLLLVAAVPAQSDRAVRGLLTGLFRRHGLPRAIRADNGVPFGGGGVLGLTTLSVWWLRLGIQVEFGRPAQPQDNGAHEQMHRMLKTEATRPPSRHAAAQHRRLQRWRQIYNHQRPHEALGQRVPAQSYRSSPRRWPRRLPRWRYRPAWPVRLVSAGGWLHWAGRRRLIGRPFAGERIALRTRGDHHEVYLGPHLLGLLYPDDLGGLRPARRTPTKP